MNSLDVVCGIFQVADSSATAASIFKHLATRKRRRKVETVRRLQQICGKGTPRPAVIGVLRQLEANGFGKLIVGRRGHESRFVWMEA